MGLRSRSLRRRQPCGAVAIPLMSGVPRLKWRHKWGSWVLSRRHTSILARSHFWIPRGSPIQKIRPEAITGGVEKRDFELPRGNLATALADITRGVEYVFGDSIASVTEESDELNVRFDSGKERSFDLLFGADGLHSNVRALTFGGESKFDRIPGMVFRRVHPP